MRRGRTRCSITERTTLGSAPASQVRIADREVSRLHAELEPSERGTWVRDLGSRNGTFVENLHVTAALLPAGARLRLGGTELVLRYPTNPAPIELWPEARFGGLIGGSSPMRELFAQMARVAKTDAPVLILGETGTGKELAARAIHDASARAAAPFVIVDCAALADNLIEGELFGHTRGAFTGAVVARAGSFEAANGGTIFLDEIGELPLPVQPKLLRALESELVKRLGENEHRKIDVRLVAATHRDLRQMVNAGAFREDLYFRVAVLPLTLPPLRARPGDIADVVPALPQRTPAGAADLRERAGPDALAGQRARAAQLRRARRDRGARRRCRARSIRRAAPGARALRGVAFEQPFKEFRERWIEQGEREYLRRLLDRHERNVAGAAEQAGLDRTYVYRLIRKHGL